MNGRMCKCCGETMSETGNALSRNPNLCASCSSLGDGLESEGVNRSEAASTEPGYIGQPTGAARHKNTYRVY